MPRACQVVFIIQLKPTSCKPTCAKVLKHEASSKISALPLQRGGVGLIEFVVVAKRSLWHTECSLDMNKPNRAELNPDGQTECVYFENQ